MKTNFQSKSLPEYNDNTIINELKRIVERLGHIPTQNEFDKHSRVKARTIRKRFGSWEKALEKAGFPMPDEAQEMINELERIKTITGGKYFSRKFYKKNKGRYCAETLKKALGYSNWADLLKGVIGVTRLNMNDMKDDLNRVKKLNNNEYFTEKFYINDGAANYKPYKLIKGLGYKDWNELQNKELGLVRPKKIYIIIKEKPTRSERYTEEDMFDEIKRVWDDLGQRPTRKLFKEKSKISIWYYTEKYGAFKKALECFSLNRDYQFGGRLISSEAKQVLLQELQQIADKNNKGLLSFKQYQALGGKHNLANFQLTFGTWSGALKEIRHEAGRGLKYSPEELFDRIQNVWERIGKEPTCKEMEKYGEISIQPFSRRFGSWRKAIHAFCDDRNNSEEEKNGKIDNAYSSNHASSYDADVIQRQLETVADSTINEANPIINSQVVPVISSNIIIKTTCRTPSKKLRFQVLQRDKFTCKYCGKSPSNTDNVKLQIDHIKPYSEEGGETVLDNLRTSCYDCNIGKSNAILD